MRRSFAIAVVASLLLHVLPLVTFLLWHEPARMVTEQPVPPPPTEQGAVELMMVEQEGAGEPQTAPQEPPQEAPQEPSREETPPEPPATPPPAPTVADSLPLPPPPPPFPPPELPELPEPPPPPPPPPELSELPEPPPPPPPELSELPEPPPPPPPPPEAPELPEPPSPPPEPPPVPERPDAPPPRQPDPQPRPARDRPDPKATTANASPAREAMAPEFNLGGTDSPSNAIVLGDAVIPASPDNQSRNRPPIYPIEATRRGQQGTVTLLIHVSPLGVSLGADVLQSSGYPLLDRAALDAIATWRFRPAVRNGTPVPFDMPMRFTFALE